MFDKKIIKKILVVQFYQIGDVLLTTPLVKYLKQEFSEAELHFCANKLPAKLLENNPYIDKIIINESKNKGLKEKIEFFRKIKKENYDLVIDTLGTNGTALLTYLTAAKYRIGWNLRIRKFAYNYIIPRFGDCYAAKAKLKILEYFTNKDYDPKPEIYLKDNDFIKVNEFFINNNFNNDDFIIVISPYSRREARRWDANYYSELCDLLVEKYNAKIIIQFGPGEEDYVNSIIKNIKNKVYLDPNTNLRELAALISKSRLFIGNDNGPKHLAVAVGTPTITIYGPTNPINWEYTNQSKHYYLQNKNLECIACGKRICDKKNDNFMKCMKNIKPCDVIDVIEKHFKDFQSE
ncbi:MAG TPA: glycosyltransferase family 9 protein [Ignavibacteriales bacterium]|nr:glycosyltransferase family 9 protein [Ignavibacteriales bacterium]